jgi:hypothetical protein
MQRPTLVQSYLSTVPVSLNCNDAGISDTTINVRRMDEPTEMSMNVTRTKVLIVLNKLYMDSGHHLSSYRFVADIDTELSTIIDDFPWFFNVKNSHRWTELPQSLDFIRVYNILHTCICMQRIRMYRPFIHSDTGAWEMTLTAARDALAVYEVLRTVHTHQPQSPRKYGIAHYQVYSVAVTLAVLLLVETPVPDERIAAIRSCIELVISDLDQLSREEKIPVALEESKIISQILEMYDSPEQTKGLSSDQLVAQIYTVVGGRMTTKNYLERGSAHLTPHSAMSQQPVVTDERDRSQSKLRSQSPDSPWSVGSGQYLDMHLGANLPHQEHHIIGDYIEYGYLDWNWDSVLSMDNY